MDAGQLFDGCLLITPQVDLHEATADMPATAGVSLLTDEADHPILLLFGANLRAQVRRRLAHNEHEEKSKRTQLRPVVRRIWFRKSYSAFETQLAYFNIARAVYPDSYRDFFPRLDVWFIQVNPQAEYPLFSVTNHIKTEPEKCWGPFARKKSATSYLELLQDTFDLCRCNHLLDKGCDVTACAYAQMGRCGAVQEGTFSGQLYRQTVDRAVDFLHNPPAIYLAGLEGKMKSLAAEHKYERAQHLKRQIGLIRKFLSPQYRWVVPLEKFYVLAFQSGPAIRQPHRRVRLPTVSPFLIGPGWIKQIEPCPLEPPEKVAGQILDHFNLARMQESNSSSFSAPPELFAWITQQLYGKSGSGDFFLWARDDISVEAIGKILQERFARPAKRKEKLKLDNYTLSGQDEIDKEP